MHLSEIGTSKQQYQKEDQEISISLLKDAFPEIDIKIVNAVLIASQGSIAPAFEALLSITDVNYNFETLQHMTYINDNKEAFDAMRRQQIENDYIYACQLNLMATQPRNVNTENLKVSHNNTKKERSFVNVELPILRDNIKQGFDDAKIKVSNFFVGIKKKIDGNISFNEKTHGSPSSSILMKSKKQSKISFNDHDPHSFVLEDDFSHLDLENNEKIPLTISSCSCRENKSNLGSKTASNNTS